MDYLAFSAAEPGNCTHSNETPTSIAPQALHPPTYFQPLVFGTEGEEGTLDGFATLQMATTQVSLVIPEPQEAPISPCKLFPMKKDRAKGSANLHRTVRSQTVFSFATAH